MSYRVVIPTAGIGSRLGKYTKELNKSLIAINNKPIISHIIDGFPDGCEFIIALGFKGELVKEYLNLAYPSKKFTYVIVEKYQGKGSGLGLTLNRCKNYLQCPFVFISCDTLIKDVIPPPTTNWMGISKNICDIENYRTVARSNTGNVASIFEKTKNKGDALPYIGLAGIYDFELFWEGMSIESAIEEGEIAGLKNILLTSKLSSLQFNWVDTGQIKNLERAIDSFQEPESPNILHKPGEAIWFNRDIVIKYSDDENFIKNRVKRAVFLKGYVPEIIGSSKHMYAYKKAEGTVLSDCLNQNIFRKFLLKCDDLWEKVNLSKEEHESFQKCCLSFYKEKTKQRIELFYKLVSTHDRNHVINGVRVGHLSNLLKRIDWKIMANGLPVRFHGDLHFENVIYNHVEDKFCFLDWRQDFSGNLYIGDVYYDLAKIYHGLLVSHQKVLEGNFVVVWKLDEIEVSIRSNNIYNDCADKFLEWASTNKYNVKKIKILTALIFLNIAGLHHQNYALFLHGYGKKMLFDILENKK